MTNTTKILDDFEIGDKIIYIPNHADNHIGHEDCEDGEVTSVNDSYVFCKFSENATNGQACRPDNLIHSHLGKRNSHIISL